MDRIGAAVLFMNALSAAFALRAAFLWWRSSQVNSPNKFPIEIILMHTASDAPGGAEILSSGSSPELDNIGAALIEQSHLSASAAISASIAAALQALALATPYF